MKPTTKAWAMAIGTVLMLVLAALTRNCAGVI